MGDEFKMSEKRKIMWAVRLIGLMVLLWGGMAWGATVYVGNSPDTTMRRNTTGPPILDTDTASTIQAAVTASGTGGSRADDRTD